MFSKIKKYLKRNGITQRSVSRRTGISKDKLCGILNGKHQMSANDYKEICSALGLSLDYFACEGGVRYDDE